MVREVDVWGFVVLMLDVNWCYCGMWVILGGENIFGRNVVGVVVFFSDEGGVFCICYVFLFYLNLVVVNIVCIWFW